MNSYVTALASPTPLRANAGGDDTLVVRIMVDGVSQEIQCRNFVVDSIHTATKVAPENRVLAFQLREQAAMFANDRFGTQSLLLHAAKVLEGKTP